MTKSDMAKSGKSRGRGLDVLFDSSTAPVDTPQPIDEDLAALLDQEVVAAEAGVSPKEPVTPVLPSDIRAGPQSSGAEEPPERIDVPPSAGEALPVEPELPGAPEAPGGVAAGEPSPEPEPERKLPATKRFGAIIMETAPAEQPAPAAAIEEPRFELRTTAPPGPGGQPAETPLPAATQLSDEQKAIIISRLDSALGEGWLKALHKQIDELYKQVATEFSSPPAQAEKALSLLREARQTLIERPEDYVTAEYRTLQVRAMLDRTRESRKQSHYYGPRILGYEVAWMLLFLLGLVFTQPVAAWVGYLANMSQATMNDVFPFWNTMLWGGIGGVIGALYHLWWHVSDQQDFDRHYMMWYLVQPIMGLVLGGILYLILAGGFLVLQINLTDEKVSTAARLLPYLAAVLGGFRQNFVYEQFDRLIAMFTPGTRGGGGGGSTA
jgi:hypothetical protein